ncbi:GalNAc(5)-diNAcBac-PP-undecaprenol beta-1,3-glucosyltransferase [Rubripirellula lacrimiformis]|uniref:GalNAc(5)-diNAcBac-PP-undecaprenol beta-1,3-glucosyltransferase n=1 Tax=Rubripirellula lacrimiformis TaxID=1930273 RepID=A0A517N8M7_9BACT|nr:glycosyltransferase family A protein [Rubripirellula lacrimiformis]QDT03496.1 GalNAc(5)-diNAcBac-PP-undecaprenol beta-1,3-glucosyltransferase [Rubripirellula lacrimiformis]
MNPAISIVTPTYNREKLLARTLDSVFNQEFRDFEVIIVDDGSSDGTIDCARSYGDAVTVLERNHLGCAAARNAGTQIATGQYLFFLDSDDILFPWSLDTFMQAAQRYEPTIIAGDLRYFSDESELNEVHIQPLHMSNYKNYFEGSLQCGFYFGTGVCMIKSSAFRDSGGFLEKDIAATDSDMLFRLGTCDGFVKIHSPLMLGYRNHDQNILKSMHKVHGGARMLIDAEKSGRYPGGKDYKRHRDQHIGMRVRAMSLKLAKSGFTRSSMDIFRRSLWMNLRRMRLKFFVGYPLYVIAGMLKNTRPTP